MATDRPPLPALTSLRFFAAFYVLLLHTACGYFHNAVTLSFLETGYVAVDFFYVLSGFVLTYRYISANGEMIGSQRDFWAARFARIYPVYVFSLALNAWPHLHSVAIGESMHSVIVKATITGVASLFLVQSWFYRTAWGWNGPAWSLSVEAFLYAVFPWLATRVFRSERSTAVLGGCLWLLALAVPCAYLLANPDHLARVHSHSSGVFISTLDTMPIFHVPAFLIGVVAARQFVKRRRQPAAWVLPALLIATLAVCTAGQSLPYPMVHNGLFAPLFAAVIYAAAASDSRTVRVLGWRPLVVLGDASYALYLIHIPLLEYARMAMGDKLSPIEWLVYTASAVTLSVVLYYWLEIPMRSRLRSWLSPRRPAAVAATL